jgi:hypothetical protein
MANRRRAGLEIGAGRANKRDDEIRDGLLRELHTFAMRLCAVRRRPSTRASSRP